MGSVRLLENLPPDLPTKPKPGITYTICLRKVTSQAIDILVLDNVTRNWETPGGFSGFVKGPRLEYAKPHWIQVNQPIIRIRDKYSFFAVQSTVQSSGRVVADIKWLMERQREKRANMNGRTRSAPRVSSFE